MIAIEYLLVIGSVLILLSIVITKFSENLGVPVLLLFLVIGMFAGSEGPGGIYFDDANLAKSIGIISLVFILFAGGFDTNWKEVKPVLWQSVSLATIGVLITTITVGVFISLILGFPLIFSLLIGAVVSSTDAAAVFSVLRSRNINLKGNLKPLLELESGSNDPMAIFLTIGIIQIITMPQTSAGHIILLFVLQMGIGSLLGFIFGKAFIFTLNHLKLNYEGIYPVFALAFVSLTYGITTSLDGSGFLAVYITGLIAGKSMFVHKKNLLRFFDGMAWLGQITMFLTLGLLVFPSQILPIIGIGLLISGFMMFISRPLSIFISLLLVKIGWRDKGFISWVGLRGAVPIILATFPLLAGLTEARLIFNLVFFIVLTSALIQGWSIPYAAKLFKVDKPLILKRRYPIEFAPLEGVDTELVDLIVPYNSAAVGRPVVELGLPQDSLLVLISRDNDFLVPSGGTVLLEGDTVLVLVNKTNLPKVKAVFSKLKQPE
jgi:potassium/hydrogen antiporter